MLDFLLKRKLIVGLFVTFIFGLGFYSLTNLDKELFPSVTFNQSLIMVETEEMTAEDVEQLVTVPIENILEPLEDVKSYEATTSPSNSVFMIDFVEDANDDMTKEIENEVNALTNELHGVKDVLVMQATTEGQYELFMDISGGSMEEVSAHALDVVKPRLESLNEVKEVLITGLEEKEVLITLKPDKLTKFDVTQNDIVTMMEQMNTNSSIGSLDEEQGDPTIRWNTAFHTIQDIKETLIQTNEGPKQLSTLATIEEKKTEQTDFAWKNGSSDFLLLQIGRANGYTQIDMADAVRAEVEMITKEHDHDIQVNEIAAQADYVSNAIDGVTSNILIGGIIAVIVLLLFLRNVRATFIIGLSIPASILLTMLTMTYLDYSLNLLSLIGLGLGIGMMVDASIVVLESIFNKKEQGFPSTKAVIHGTKEVLGAVISSMLTTIVVFVPVVLMDDEIGKMMIVLTMVVAITLISSVIISFTLIPVLSENFLKVNKAKQGKGVLVGKYGRIIEWLSKKKRRKIGVLSLAIVMFFSSFLLLAKIPMTFMPDILNRYAEVVIELEPGVSSKEREEIAIAMNDELEQVTDIESSVIIDNIDVVIALINMTPAKDKTMEQDEVNEQILERFRTLEDNYPIKSAGAAMDGVANPSIELRVSGNNLTTLQDIGNEVVNELETIEDISSVNMALGESEKEYVIQLDHDNMEEDGLVAPDLYREVDQLFANVPVGDVLKDGETTPIFIENNLNVQDKEKLLDQQIMTMNGEQSLSRYIALEKTTAFNEINRSDGERYIRIIADSESQDIGRVNQDINQVIQDINEDVDKGYSIEVAGDMEAQQQAVQDLIVIFIISLFLVFVVMAIQFNSLIHPFIILFIIPLTITGVLIGLFVTQKELNIMSGIGVIMLVGIVLNNGILLIDRVKQIRNNGLDVNEAMVQAGKERIRPIFMTTLTTVGGMIPLAIASGTSSGYQAPLAVVIISGLLFSTFLTLILIPVIYLLFEDIKIGFKRIFRRNKSTDDNQPTVKAQ